MPVNADTPDMPDCEGNLVDLLAALPTLTLSPLEDLTMNDDLDLGG